MINKFIKFVYGLKRYERMLKVPRQYANHIDPDEIDDDSAFIMARSTARSPENVVALLKEHGVDSVDKLIDLLPDQRYRRRPRARILSIMRAITGSTPHNPDLSRWRRLKARGWFDKPEIHERIRRLREFE